MLYQPTNVYPSLTGGLGNGVIDADKDLTVSWQVNGNTAMDSFSIQIYKNDTASTLCYSSGTQTENCPFHGVSYTGEIQFFSYTISVSDLASAGIINGNEYKMVISQTSGSTTVTQIAASAFYARATPAISIATFPTELPYSKYTFELEYPSSGDPLNWARWRVANWDAEAEEAVNILYDSGDIYGASDLRCEYDGFLSGERYAVRCDIETSYGVQTSTGWTAFTAAYDLLDFSGELVANKICGSSGIQLTLDNLKYIPGTGSGSYSVTDRTVTLESGASIYWDTVNYRDMEISTPWTFFFRGNLTASPGQITAYRAGDDFNFQLIVDTSSTTPAITVYLGSKTYHISWLNFKSGSILRQFVLAPTAAYAQILTPADGLFPETTLYPKTTLYPSAVDGYSSYINKSSPSYTQYPITKIQADGPIEIDYIWVLQEAASDEFVRTIMRDSDFSPSFSEYPNTAFAATFDSGIGGGNMAQLENGLDSFSVYRQDNDSRYLKHIVDLPMTETAFADYGVASQSTYRYYIYPASATSIVLAPAVSKYVNVCFWDWVIMECERDSSGYYEVVSEYKFGKNLSSGSASNNNSPNLITNFTQYPLVQLSSQNYRSGTLTSLIGYINANCEYSDTIALRDTIYNLSTTQNSLFLKNRKGDLMQIRINGAISMETMDGTRQQAQTVSIPWVEIGSAEGKSIVAFGKYFDFLTTQ